MRDRLIELLTDNLPKADNPLQFVSDELVERLADYLLENGVILPPCKVGDAVYSIFNGRIKELKVISYSVLNSTAGNYQTIHTVNSRGAVVSYELHNFGKTVFLTKEEAEQALKGGAEE